MDLQPEEDGNEEKELEEFNKDNFVPSNETPAPNEKKSEKMEDSSGHSSQVATEGNITQQSVANGRDSRGIPSDTIRQDTEQKRDRPLVMSKPMGMFG